MKGPIQGIMILYIQVMKMNNPLSTVEKKKDSTLQKVWGGELKKNDS